MSLWFTSALTRAFMATAAVAIRTNRLVFDIAIMFVKILAARNGTWFPETCVPQWRITFSTASQLLRYIIYQLLKSLKFMHSGQAWNGLGRFCSPVVTADMMLEYPFTINRTTMDNESTILSAFGNCLDGCNDHGQLSSCKSCIQLYCSTCVAVITTLLSHVS